MKKKSKILALLTTLTLICTAAGCSGKDAVTTTPAADGSSAGQAAQDSTAANAASKDKITITYWNTNRHDQEYMTPLYEEFNNTNSDNIYIDYQIYAENYSQMLDLAFSTDSAPDVFQIPNNEFSTITEKGYALDIAPYMDDAYRARFGDGAFVEGINSIGDAVYSLPYTASAVRLFYNKDIFERVGIDHAPETLAEMVEDAKLITEQLSGEGIYGIAGNYKGGNAVARTIDPIVMKSGGTRNGFDYKTGTFDFSSYKPVLEAFRDMYSTGAAFPGSESLDIDPLRTQFAAGKIAMYMSLSHAEPGVYESQFPTDIHWDCALVPTVDGTAAGKQQLWVGGSNLAVNANTEHPEESWKVMEFLHSDEVMSGYYTAGLGTVMIPSAVEKAEPPESMKKMPCLELTEDDQNWPALPTNMVVEGKDYPTVCTEVIFGITDVDAAIEDLNTRYNAAYDKLVESGQERIVYPNFDPLNQNTDK